MAASATLPRSFFEDEPPEKGSRCVIEVVDDADKENLTVRYLGEMGMRGERQHGEFNDMVDEADSGGEHDAMTNKNESY